MPTEVTDAEHMVEALIRARISDATGIDDHDHIHVWRGERCWLASWVFSDGDMEQWRYAIRWLDGFPQLVEIEEKVVELCPECAKSIGESAERVVEDREVIEYWGVRTMRIEPACWEGCVTCVMWREQRGRLVA